MANKFFFNNVCKIKYGRFCALLCAFSCFILPGCTDEVINTNEFETEQLPESNTGLFDFAMVKDFDLDIDLNLSPGTTTGSVLYHIYTEDPFVYMDGVNTEMMKENISPLYVGYTTERATDQVRLSIPLKDKELYVVSMGIGVQHVMTVPVNGSPIRINASEQARSSVSVTRAGTLYNTITAPKTYAWYSWDASGIPTVLKTPDVIKPQTMTNIRQTLPEGLAFWKNPIAKDWIHPDAITTIETIEKVSIDVTFMYEGAGFLNSFGYYYYPTGNPPTDVTAVKKYVLFPNASLPGSGGNLNAGSRIKLQYYNGTQYIDTFPAGITIGWCVLANGYNSSTHAVTAGNWLVTSDPHLNPGGLQQVIQMRDTISNDIIICFEDWRRDQGGDNDFNDMIFHATANPYTAIHVDDVPTLPFFKDSDGDGVPDSSDEFPRDPAISRAVHYPGNKTIDKAKWGTLCFEDHWPCNGDYDMNDQVIYYNIVNYLNGSGNVVYTTGALQLVALGAADKSGFVMNLGIPASQVKKTQITGGNWRHNVFSIASNGCENKQSKAHIVMWDDGFTLFGASHSSSINTTTFKEKSPFRQITFRIDYTTPISPSSFFTPPYDSYIVINSPDGERGRECHLPGFAPSNLADQSLFSTCNDLTNLANKVYYKGANNMPFAMNFPSMFMYPTERVDIQTAYLHFFNWASSNGSSHTDWYSNTSAGYRDKTKIYNK